LFGGAQIDNADLVSVGADQPNLGGGDFVIDAVTFWCSDS
jgi:hypothetical protein